MNNYLYCILDKLSGLYSQPVPHLNDECAIRWFVNIINKSECEPTDYSLYRVAVFNPKKGLIKKDFKFIRSLVRGEKVKVDLNKGNILDDFEEEKEEDEEE